MVTDKDVPVADEHSCGSLESGQLAGLIRDYNIELPVRHPACPWCKAGGTHNKCLAAYRLEKRAVGVVRYRAEAIGVFTVTNLNQVWISRCLLNPAESIIYAPVIGGSYQYALAGSSQSSSQMRQYPRFSGAGRALNEIIILDGAGINKSLALAGIEAHAVGKHRGLRSAAYIKFRQPPVQKYICQST